jgi:hypothetical protein
MGVKVEYVPAVRDVLDDALRRIARAGVMITDDASAELGELVLSGYRLMQASRILDLPADSPERQRQEALARANLLGLIDSWLDIERARGSRELTIGGFRRAYAKLCPVYPCEE